MSADPVTGWEILPQAAFAVEASGMLWDDGRWDESTWNASETEDSTWIDLACQTLTAAVRAGASRTNGVLTRYESATLELELFDPDRLLDPFNTAGYARFGRLRQRAGVRLIARHISAPTVLYPLFTGFLESLTYTWADSMCRIIAADAVSYLSLYDPPAGDPVGAGETAAARVTRILDAASWPADLRDVRAGGPQLVADTLEGTAWDELLSVAEVDLGLLTVDPAGVVTFIPREAVPWDVTTDAVCGDGSGLPIVDAAGNDTDPPINLVTASRVDGPEITVADPVSAAMYGYGNQPVYHAIARKDLPFLTDDEVSTWIRSVLEVHAYPDARISPVSLTLTESDPLAWVDVAALRIGHRWLIQCTDLQLSRDQHIRGWSHEISRNPSSLIWDTAIVTTSATWTTPMIWDDPKLGFWDEYRWQ